MREGGEFYEQLLRFATTRDATARGWLAEALSRYEYATASRIWVFYTIGVCLFGFFALAAGLWGCGLTLALALLIVPMNRLDRIRRRQKAWKGLGEGKASIHSKLEVKMPTDGSRIFQSYWTTDMPSGRVELDHPMELREAVEQADEWWQWIMPVPHEDNGGVKYLNVHFDLGLVRCLPDGGRELVAAGVVYFSYDPWAGRIDTGGYQ